MVSKTVNTVKTVSSKLMSYLNSSSFGCNISIILIIIFIIIFISYTVYINNEANTLNNQINQIEKFDNSCYKKQQYTEDSIKYPVMSPNIPVDNEQNTHIDYDGNNVINESYDDPTGINESSVKLIKPQLKYDGIFDSKRQFNNTSEIQGWNLSTDDPIKSTYGDNKLLPPKNYPF
tara:strand:+ start:11686 stop:12213 length:528 start_codon:yes stop_codon:yes gene_type:complete